MQLSARILTALAVLAFTFAVITGMGNNADEDVSAATGMIDALNVGACTTTNSDLLGIGNCTNTMAFFEAGTLGSAVEVDELYATYAHDPKSASEAPRAIITNGDLVKVSIKDEGRDRRDHVLIGADGSTYGGSPLMGVELTEVQDSVGDDLSMLPVEMPTAGLVTAAPGETGISLDRSGTYTIVFDNGGDATNPYKPLASQADRGVVKFFGMVGDSAFKELSANVTLDEDVVSGEPDVPPAIVIRATVPAGQEVDIEVIYYQTSEVETLTGGQMYSDVSSDDMTLKSNVLYTSSEMGNDTALYSQASSDGNTTSQHLVLEETHRFSGVYQGYLRLTDADGDGENTAGERTNWGRATMDAMDSGMDGAAVLGVGDGPVTITYRDSGGKMQSRDIQIDIEAPTIIVDSPVNSSSSDDEKPTFAGTFYDSDAGLARDSFQLYVDNDPRGSDTEYVFDNDGLNSASVMGPGGGAKVERRLDYTGYDAEMLYGVVSGDLWEAASDADHMKFKSVEADNFANGASDGEFDDEIELDFDEFDPNVDVFNHKIEFQGLVRDLAGNVGFTDSNLDSPRFIRDLGNDAAGVDTHNVLGVFSRHHVWLDELDPYIMSANSATGYYGMDSSDNLLRERSALMIVFDNDVDGATIDTGTFTVSDEIGDPIGVTEVTVDGKYVFLMTDREIGPAERPTVNITDGREIEDMAANVLRSEEHILDPDDSEKVTSFKLNDGILPTFTLTLSGGSGSGTGNEGPSKLTNDAMEIAVESDEAIRGVPKVSIVCSNIGFHQRKSNVDLSHVTDEHGADVVYGLSQYITNRTGVDADTGNEAPDNVWMNCGKNEQYTPMEASSLSRPGNNWVYSWRNPSAESAQLKDGKLVVVVWGSDESTYQGPDGERDNWGSASATFSLDTTLYSPLTPRGGEVQPSESSISESRPFILLDFAGESTSVELTTLDVNGESVLGSIDTTGVNRYLYWPEDLGYGSHSVAFGAQDAAGNNITDGGTKFSFNVTARDPFVLDIIAGWNAVSFPADPVDGALDSVFTESAVDRVVGWDPTSDTGPWSIASRIDGVWTTSDDFAPLTNLEARYGYWVHASAFVKQAVVLEGPIDRASAGYPSARSIATVSGWNFVGVVDQDGDQTEGNWGQELKDSEGNVVSAGTYMPNYVRAYTWDPIAHGYQKLESGESMTIGDGVWVYFGKSALAP